MLSLPANENFSCVIKALEKEIGDRASVLSDAPCRWKKAMSQGR